MYFSAVSIVWVNWALYHYQCRFRPFSAATDWIFAKPSETDYVCVDTTICFYFIYLFIYWWGLAFIPGFREEYIYIHRSGVLFCSVYSVTDLGPISLSVPVFALFPTAIDWIFAEPSATGQALSNQSARLFVPVFNTQKKRKNKKKKNNKTNR